MCSEAPLNVPIVVTHGTITCFSLLQSKDIGVQMHEELVKVTNELYTVSKCISFPFPVKPFSVYTHLRVSPMLTAVSSSVLSPRSSQTSNCDM